MIYSKLKLMANDSRRRMHRFMKKKEFEQYFQSFSSEYSLSGYSMGDTCFNSHRCPMKPLVHLPEKVVISHSP